MLKKKTILGYHNKLPIRPLRKLELPQNYGVSLIIENENQTTTIKYELSLCWRTDDDNFIVEINKISQVYINSKLPDLMIENLAVDTFEVMYPISFTLNNNGEITDIHNFKELKQRWQTHKDSLKQNRQGEVLEKYLLLAENTLKNKADLLEKIKTNWFIHTFFLGVHKIYGETYEIDHIVCFPFTPGVKPLVYQTRQQISKYLDDYGMIQIKIKGELVDLRTIKDFEHKLSESYFHESKKLTGTFFAQYFVNPAYNQIDTFITECTLNTEQTKTITIKVSSIN